MGPSSARPLVALAAVFLAVAVWNGVLALDDRTAWRTATAAVCAVASAGLLLVAVRGGSRGSRRGSGGHG